MPCCEKPLGIECAHRAGARGGDRLAVDVVLHVADGEDAGDVRLGRVRLRDQVPGVVVVEGIWPNRNFETGMGINALTSADPGWPHGGAVFHDTAVWIRKAA